MPKTRKDAVNVQWTKTTNASWHQEDRCWNNYKHLKATITRMTRERLEDGSVGKGLATQAWKSEFRSQHPQKRQAWWHGEEEETNVSHCGNVIWPSRASGSVSKGKLILEKKAKNTHYREESIFIKWCSSNWISTCTGMKLDPYLQPCSIFNSRWTKGPTA